MDVRRGGDGLGHGGHARAPEQRAYDLAERIRDGAPRAAAGRSVHVASKDDPEAVEQVTQDLSEYLRFSLREARALEPLARELHALEKYPAVQQRRFGENLVCRITADRAAPRVLVPPMMNQPLLENALNYGAQTSSMPLQVNVRASVKDDVLEVIVANSGRWVPPACKARAAPPWCRSQRSAGSSRFATTPASA